MKKILLIILSCLLLTNCGVGIVTVAGIVVYSEYNSNGENGKLASSFIKNIPQSYLTFMTYNKNIVIAGDVKSTSDLDTVMRLVYQQYSNYTIYSYIQVDNTYTKNQKSDEITNQQITKILNGQDKIKAMAINNTGYIIVGSEFSQTNLNSLSDRILKLNKVNKVVIFQLPKS